MTKSIKARKVIMTKHGANFSDCTAIVNTTINQPQENEVLIRNIYAGVNGVYDINMIRDALSFTSYKPPTDLGIEVVGVIQELGEGVNDFCIGEYVASWSVGSGYRNFQTANVNRLYKIPEPTPEMVCLLPTGISGMIGIEQVGELRSNETVAVSAAAGGLGHIIVQVAKKAGNHVIGVCGTHEKASKLKLIGCDRVINYKIEDLEDVLKNESPSGLDIAYDSVGGGTFDAFLNNIAIKGRLVISGYTSEVGKPWENINQPRIYTKLYSRGASVRAFMNQYYEKYYADAAKRLIEMYTNKELNVFVDPIQFTGLESIPNAVNHLLSGNNIGKVVIKIE